MKKAELRKLWDICDYEKLYGHYENRNCLSRKLDPFEKFYKDEALKREIGQEQGGLGLAKFYFQDGFKKLSKFAAAVAVSAFLVAVPLSNMMMDSSIANNAESFQDEIADYSERVANFAQEIRELNLQDDFSKILEVKRRLHEYGVGENGFMLNDGGGVLEVSGHWGLDVVQGMGNCRHISIFARDVLHELGISNNAVTTFMPEAPDGAMLNNVQRTFAPQEMSDAVDTSSPFIDIAPDSFFIRRLAGNHALNRVNNMSIMCSDTGELLTLNNVYVDMTNPQFLMSIRGQNGLVSFNQTNMDGDDWIQIRTHLANPENMHFNNAHQMAWLHINDILGGVSREQFDELRNLMGLEAQNETLNDLRNNSENIAGQ